jgi:very-short-patch-repair endonuclease
MPSVRWTPEQLQEWQQRQAKPKPEPANPAPKESKLERRFVQQLTDAGISGWQRNYYFLGDRDLELDFAWPETRLAVEVQGMAHRIKGKFRRDIEKRALALLAGWRVLEVDGAAIRDGRALKWLRLLLSD